MDTLSVGQPPETVSFDPVSPLIFSQTPRTLPSSNFFHPPRLLVGGLADGAVDVPQLLDVRNPVQTQEEEAEVWEAKGEEEGLLRRPVLYNDYGGHKEVKPRIQESR